MSPLAKGTPVLASAGEVAKATAGVLQRGEPSTGCNGVNTDSRVPAPGALFIALKGENFDGARFAAEAASQGASILMVEESAWSHGRIGDTGAAAVVTVKDTLRGLGDLAAWHRRRFPVRVIGITGSNGKTSTKEMTTSVLGGSPHVLHNPGNLNNLVGMPRSLMSLGESHLHAVMEMGMNAPGEIARLSEIASPQVGVITNVHPVHLEGLGSIEAVARAKAELIEALPGDGTAILNADDPYVLKMATRTRANRVTFGRVPNADVQIASVHQMPETLQLMLMLQGRQVPVQLKRPGLHNAMNAAAAAAVGMIEGVDPEAIAERLTRSPMPSMRMEQLELGPGQLLVDCYNANPRSVQAALATLVLLTGEGLRYAVLGDMRELGESAADLHRQVGRAVVSSGVNGLCCFGPLAEAVAEGARDAGMATVVHTDLLEEAVDWARERVQSGGMVLLKGSRAMRMERIAARLAREFNVSWREVEE